MTAPHCPPPHPLLFFYFSSKQKVGGREGRREGGRKGELDMGRGVSSFGIDVMVVWVVGGGGEEEEETEEK